MASDFTGPQHPCLRKWICRRSVCDMHRASGIADRPAIDESLDVLLPPLLPLLLRLWCVFIITDGTFRKTGSISISRHHTLRIDYHYT